jgi:hypothetical protein
VNLSPYGPAGADKTVLLLPAGMWSARSYAEVMSNGALAGTRLVTATLPGQAGTAAPSEFCVEHYARSRRNSLTVRAATS